MSYWGNTARMFRRYHLPENHRLTGESGVATDLRHMHICINCLAEYPVHRAFCLTCLEGGTITVKPHRVPPVAPEVVTTATARDLVRREWSTITSDAYPDLVVGRGALVALYGEPGAGKSTMLAKLLDGLSGPVVLAAAEEGLGPAVAARLSRLGITRPDFTIVGSAPSQALLELVTESSATGLGIDSVTATPLLPSDLRAILAAAPGLGILACTLQVTKAGAPAGRMALLHEADVVIRVYAMQFTVEKSRFGPTGTWQDV